mgnify:CR=1 FL=1|tara:strand:+ start:5686 stop:6066 length:381 start_codon:yes stop_codon:yes gene_type:complete
MNQPQTIGFTNVRFMEVIESEPVPTDPPGGVSNRWKYQVRSIKFDTDTGEIGTPADAFTLPRAGIWNVCELANTQSVAMGIQIVNLPGNFALQPVPIGTIVPVYLTVDDNKWTGFLIWPNQFDGAC